MAMSDNDTEDAVGVPPTFKQELTEILAYAASQDRTVIEFRTTETAGGKRHLAHALDITEHVSEMEQQLDEEPER